MSDIVKRLRRKGENEAADEIARLREALKLTRRALKEECDFITEELRLTTPHCEAP